MWVGNVFIVRACPQRSYKQHCPLDFLLGMPHLQIFILHFFSFVDLQKNRCMRKELESSDLCLRLKYAATTFDLAYILRSDIRSILSTPTIYLRVKLELTFEVFSVVLHNTEKFSLSQTLLPICLIVSDKENQFQSMETSVVNAFNLLSRFLTKSWS